MQACDVGGAGVAITELHGFPRRFECERVREGRGVAVQINGALRGLLCLWTVSRGHGFIRFSKGNMQWVSTGSSAVELTAKSLTGGGCVNSPTPHLTAGTLRGGTEPANMAISLHNMPISSPMKKESPAVRYNLPRLQRGLLSCAALSVWTVAGQSSHAFAANFTRCEQSTATPVDCLPGSGTPSLPASFSVTADGTATLDTVFKWRVKNCKSRLGQLRGQLSVVLDNSKSAATTDMSSTRAGVLNTFMQQFADNALNSGVNTNNPGYPQIALINYNGRAGLLDPNSQEDSYNPKFTPSYCTSPSPAFPDAAAVARWNEGDSGGKYSVCEYLPLRIADSRAAVFPLQQFASFAAQAPRGSTDFTYFFKAAGTVFQAANTGNVGRHVLTITDGLPNVPKNVAKETCESTPRLQKEAIVSGILLGQQRQYCVDRQAVQAIADAHSEAQKSDYAAVNFHHVLYTADQRAYFDYDENVQKLNPADFLIENSARTGNGKVKFSYAKQESELDASLDNLFTLMDANALQYVSVEVQPANLKYKAVSPGAPGSEFSIKFIGLRQGANTVTVTSVYQDGSSSSQSFAVTVAPNTSPSTTAGLQCTAAGDDKTVDGDPIGAKSPKGDGFYNRPNNKGDYRDYRNADAANDLTESEFASVDADQSAAELTKLRIQGGTGNCGVLSDADNKNNSSLIMVALLLLPLCVGYSTSRRTRRQSK